MTWDGRLSTTPRCPKCDAKLDGATGVGHDEGPREGSVTICAYCETLLAFTRTLDLRVVPFEEQAEYDSETRALMRIALRAVRAAKFKAPK